MRGKYRLQFDLFHMCIIIGNDQLATYFDQITVGELSKEWPGHEGSNERASDNVRRGGCAFRLKIKFN